MTLRTRNCIIFYDSNGFPSHAYLDNARYTIPSATSLGMIVHTDAASTRYIQTDIWGAPTLQSVGVGFPCVTDVGSPFSEQSLSAGSTTTVTVLAPSSGGSGQFIVRETWVKS